MAAASTRYVGTLKVQVLSATDLKDVVTFGTMDPYVVVNVNGAERQTMPQVDAGCNATFNETLEMNIDAAPRDLITFKAIHHGKVMDELIGIFSMQLDEFMQRQGRRSKFQLVDEETFDARGIVEVISVYSGQNMPGDYVPIENLSVSDSSPAPVPSQPQPTPDQFPYPESIVAAPSQPRQEDEDENDEDKKKKKKDKKKKKKHKKHHKKHSDDEYDSGESEDTDVSDSEDSDSDSD